MKKKSNAAKTLLGLVPLFYSLAISSVGIGIGMKTFGLIFAKECRIRMLEFKKMGVIELQFIDKKEKTRVEYHPIVRIKEWIEYFLKKNPKWIVEEEDIFDIKTGRWILTRVYRRYNKEL